MVSFQNGLIDFSDLSQGDVFAILEHAKQFQLGLEKNTLKKKVVASCFFEASTRTRLSFEAAIAYLNGKHIGFSDASNTSQSAKGESFVDTIKIIDSYSDAIIIRHPNDGAARLAAEIATVPVINAGDGANQHPTQTLLDLFAIQNWHGRLEGINLGLMGDLRYSRTIRSLIKAGELFNMNIFLIAPPLLQLDKIENCQYYNHIDGIISELDCLYITRLQKERIAEIVECSYSISLNTLKSAKDNLQILHPLPRLNELPVEIDNTKHADYFNQAKNGLYIRMALLDMVFS